MVERTDLAIKCKVVSSKIKKQNMAPVRNVRIVSHGVSRGKQKNATPKTPCCVSEAVDVFKGKKERSAVRSVHAGVETAEFADKCAAWKAEGAD